MTLLGKILVFVTLALSFVMLTWAHSFRLDLSPYPKLETYSARVKERPKVLEAMKEEGLVK